MKLVNSYTWGITVCGAETCTLRTVDQKYLESFETWCWGRMEKISWTDRVKNEEVLQRVKNERNVLLTMKEGRLTGLVTNCLPKQVIE
jgi:hypothetical protein